MTKDLAKWELRILMTSRLELQKINKDLEYYDSERVKELRNFLDSQNDPEDVPKEKLDQIREEFKEKNIPF